MPHKRQAALIAFDGSSTAISPVKAQGPTQQPLPRFALFALFALVALAPPHRIGLFPLCSAAVPRRHPSAASPDGLQLVPPISLLSSLERADMAATPLHGALSCTLLLVVANLLIPISILVFATGFFPYKPFLPGLAHYEELKELNDASPPRAPFDRLVFMVVDALRRSAPSCLFTPTHSPIVLLTAGLQRFCLCHRIRLPLHPKVRRTFDPSHCLCLARPASSNAHPHFRPGPQNRSLIRDGAAMPYTANARSPTVTMPRIKAMTTGSIPSFVDLILNFDESDTSSTLAAQDTWLAQLKATKRGKLLMYGDDTWLKLFPDTFDRHDGTSSFFVSVSLPSPVRMAPPPGIYTPLTATPSPGRSNRISLKWTTTLPETLPVSLIAAIGASWYSITSVLITLATKPGPRGRQALQLHPNKALLTKISR